MAADGLFRRPSTMGDIAEAKAEIDIDNFLLIKVNSLRVLPISLDDQTPILVDKYLDQSQKIATYLTKLR